MWVDNICPHILFGGNYVWSKRKRINVKYSS